MAILNKEIVNFCGGQTAFYESMVDNYMNPKSENDTILNQGFFAEIERMSGVSRDGIANDAWASNPSVRWAMMAVVDATINAILPSVLTPAFGVFMDLRYVEPGDIMKFRVMPNALYTVSLGGKGERTTFRQKQYAGDVIVVPKEHLVTIYVDMYRVLAGKENISDFVRQVVMSVEQQMYGVALNALTTGLTAVTAGTEYTYSGAFSMEALLKMAEQVQVYNYGVRPVIAGSAVALMKAIPDSAYGYRGNYDANGGAIDLMRTIYGFEVLRLNQAAAQGGGLVLPDNQIFIVSPSQDKLVKGVVSNSMTNSNQFYDNADITQNFTYRKNYDFVYASAAKAGIYTITD